MRKVEARFSHKEPALEKGNTIGTPVVSFVNTNTSPIAWAFVRR